MSALGTSDAVSSFARVVCVVVGMSLLLSCLGKSTYVWKEEVLLHDGRVMVIQRGVKTGYLPREIGQPPPESDYTLTFEVADGKKVTWDGGRGQFVMRPGWCTASRAVHDHRTSFSSGAATIGSG